MSLELYTFLDSLPNRQAWQAAIVQVGVKLELDPQLDLSRSEGFSPCSVQGTPSGFEMHVVKVSDVVDEHPVLIHSVGKRSHALCFRWGGDFAECACVLGANLALVRVFGAVAYYPADELVYDVGTLEAELQECLAEL